MKTIYIAGKFSARGRLRLERDHIHREGIGKVISSWLDLDRDVSEHEDCKIAAAEEALRDANEVKQADLVIFDASGQTRRGGRETELGIALGAGIELWVVGDRWHPGENVFNLLAPRFSSWERVHNALLWYDL